MVTCKERKSEGLRDEYQGLRGKENVVFGVKNRGKDKKRIRKQLPRKWTEGG